MIHVVENLGQFATFRGVQDEKIVKEITEYQQSKQFADDLKTIGVESVVLGGCRDEVRFLPRVPSTAPLLTACLYDVLFFRTFSTRSSTTPRPRRSLLRTRLATTRPTFRSGSSTRTSPPRRQRPRR